MKKKFRIPLFYILYFAFIVLFDIALHLGQKTVTAYLADYESSLPEYEAQRVFDTYYASGDYSELVSLSDHQITSFETSAALETYLETFTKGKKITFNSITTGLDDSLRYIVKADDVKFSSFTIFLFPSTKKDCFKQKKDLICTKQARSKYTASDRKVLPLPHRAGFRCM